MLLNNYAFLIDPKQLKYKIFFNGRIYNFIRVTN